MEKELWQYLKTVNKPIVLYGMGNGADKIIKVLENYCISFDGVFASDGFVRNKSFHGFRISSYGELKEKFGEMVVLLCFGSDRPEVIENVKKISLENELYAPDVPVISGELFTEKYLKENEKELKWVYDRLSDDLSRKTFENTIKYKLSGKIEYLLDCETEYGEPYKSFLELTDSEKFLDLGAYNGDTALNFISKVKDYKKIIAVEPDSKTFKKLLNNTKHIENIECKNLCISDFVGEAPFGMKHGRNSKAFTGDTIAQFTTIDSIIGENGITYIKMDIEGEELNAIRGAKKTIESFSPKMLISCYHRTEDLLTIPKAVLDIKNDYKIYMRHFHSLPAWDTNYYFI